jgi:predicted nucleotidyltransferase
MLEEYNITQTTLKILGLYTDDYKKSLHLREIARETNVDVKAVQIQLKRLEKISVLSSATRGRNKEYTLNLTNIVARYYLNMAEIFASAIYLKKNFLIKKLISEIDNKIDGSIILFGSFVKGGHTKESDVDLFVITEKKLDRNLASKTGDLINRHISIKLASSQEFLNGLRSRDPLIAEVISNHIVLKGADMLCGIMWRHYEVS